MRHVILMCEDHPDLRWSCKEIAVSNGRYNGTRNIFFNGYASGRMYDDMSGMYHDFEPRDGVSPRECDCPASKLTIAPEDAMVKRV